MLASKKIFLIIFIFPATLVRAVEDQTLKTVRLSTCFARRPNKSAVIERDAAEKFIAAHPAELRGAVKFLIDNITHVTQQQFEQRLYQAIDQWVAENPNLLSN